MTITKKIDAIIYRYWSGAEGGDGFYVKSSQIHTPLMEGDIINIRSDRDFAETGGGRHCTSYLVTMV